MSPAMPTGHVDIEPAERPRIFRGVVFSLLALGQLLFAFVFAYRFYIVSQTGWATLDSRWFFPLIAIVSLGAFAQEAWRSFVPGKRRLPP